MISENKFSNLFSISRPVGRDQLSRATSWPRPVRLCDQSAATSALRPVGRDQLAATNRGVPLTRHQKMSCPNQERRDNDGTIPAAESPARDVASGSKSRATTTKDASFKVPRLRPSSASITSQEHDRETDDEEEHTRRRNQFKRNIKFPRDGFNTLQGREAAKKFMWQQFVRPAKNPKAVSSVTRSSGGILLYGPPGTGKTAIAKAAAAEAGYAFLKVDSSMISSHWMGVGGKTVNALFDVLTEAQPIVVCFDELDGLFRCRNKDSVDADLVSTFLVRLDDLDESKREGRIQVTVIATTNNTNSLDSAVRSRFSTAHRIDRPSTPEREVFLKSLFSTDHQADLTNDEWSQISARSSGADFRQLKNWAAAAGHESFDEEEKVAIRQKRKPKFDRPPTVTKRHFDAVFSEDFDADRL